MQNRTMNSLTLTRPDDWHLHLRDGAAMASVLPDTARQFARAIVMPNLKPPVTTTAQALAYAERIRQAGAIGILVTHSLEAAATADRVLRLTSNGLQA